MQLLQLKRQLCGPSGCLSGDNAHVYQLSGYIDERLTVNKAPKKETAVASSPQYTQQAATSPTAVQTAASQEKRSATPNTTSAAVQTDNRQIQYSLRTPEVDHSQRDLMEELMMKNLRQQYMAWEPKQRNRSTFSRKVLTLLSLKQIDPKAFYRQAGIDRKLFSKIKTDFCYQPNKETALRCCLALHLDVGEALDLLKSAGYTLSDSSSFDLAIRYCLVSGVYDLSAVNMLLEALEEKVFV